MAHKVKRRHIKTKHQKKRYFRANDPLLSVFMWGVNQTVTELVRHVEETTLLLPEDFKAFSKIRIENQYYNKEYLPGHFKVKEYCPLVFRDLRHRFGVEDLDYKESLTKSAPVPMDSPGRSGARFYSSYNRRFIVKGLSKEEVALMLQIIQAYHAHIVTVEGQTLLPEYVGMYRLTVADKETYWIVQRNILPARLPVHVKYDLKGSTIDRSASTKERAKTSPTFKDVDFAQELGTIKVGEEARTEFLRKIGKDVEFLQKQHLMDYSLLVGIHQCKLYPRSAEDDEEGDDEGSEEESDNGRGGATDGVIVEEDEDSAEANGDISSSTPGSPEAKTTPSPEFTIPDPTSQQPPSTPAAVKPKEGTSTDGPAPKEGERLPSTDKGPVIEPQGAAALPLPCPVLVRGPKAVDQAKSEGKWPVVDVLVDKYAVLSDPGVEPVVYFMAIIDVLTLYGAKKKAAHAAKTMKHGHGAEISTVNPDQYGKRFMEFLSRIIY